MPQNNFNSYTAYQTVPRLRSSIKHDGVQRLSGGNREEYPVPQPGVALFATAVLFTHSLYREKLPINTFTCVCVCVCVCVCARACVTGA
jgi:hypothetical protein